MSGFPILDLVLGLVFIFFILSIISSSAVEVFMTKRGIRNKVLGQWLLTIFDKKMIQPDGKIAPLGRALMDHCLTTALSKEGQTGAYMDAKNFVSALIEKLSYDPANPGRVVESLEQLLDVIRNAKAVDGTTLLSTELYRTVLLFGNEAQIAARNNPEGKDAFVLFREKVEAWFDSNMDRISGSMKRKYARPVTFAMAVIVTIAMNADTVKISRYLYEHKEEAKIFADRVAAAAQTWDTTHNVRPQDYTQMVALADSLKRMAPQSLPLGWPDYSKSTDSLLKIAGDALREHFVGWLATIMAIMLGAPFWFDLLNKIANIRGSGKPATAEPVKPDNGKSS